MKKKKYRYLWFILINPVVLKFLLILAILAIIFVNISNNSKTSNKFEPIYYTYEEICEYVKERYGEQWKVKENSQVEEINIEAYGSSEDNKRYERVKIYKYTVCKENSRDYFYIYSTTNHVYKSSWTGGWSYPIEEYEKCIKSDIISDFIREHKNEIYTLAANNNVTISIKESKYVWNENEYKMEIDIDILNEQQIANIARFTTQVYNLINVNLNVDLDTNDKKYNFNCNEITFFDFKCNFKYKGTYNYLDIKDCAEYSKAYEKLKRYI